MFSAVEDGFTRHFVISFELDLSVVILENLAREPGEVGLDPSEPVRFEP
jgi:hypothetical protein